MAEQPTDPADRSQPNGLDASADGALYEAIALKAYFIALERAECGEPHDPLQDWLEAERQFHDHQS